MSTHTPSNSHSRRLHNDVVVMPDTPLDRVWEQFHVFEALHHQLNIMNPLSSVELDQVIAALNGNDGDTILDLACGHGELLLRLAEHFYIEGLGVDLSPWQISRAALRTNERRLKGSLQWWLGRAESVPKGRSWDVVSCLGASWIWGGFEGTAQALAQLARHGGLIAIGDLQLRSGVEVMSVGDDYGDLLTSSEQRAVLERSSILPVDEIVGSAQSWVDYDKRIAESAAAYLEANPGSQAEGFVEQQQRWTDKHRDDHRFLAWTVWIGQVGVEYGREIESRTVMV